MLNFVGNRLVEMLRNCRTRLRDGQIVVGFGKIWRWMEDDGQRCDLAVFDSAEWRKGGSTAVGSGSSCRLPMIKSPALQPHFYCVNVAQSQFLLVLILKSPSCP